MAFFEFPHTRTYDSDLGWLIENVSSYDEAIQALNEWNAAAEVRLEDLEAFDALLESGQLPPSVALALTVWMQQNAVDLIGEMVKTVFFGLTDSGYFVAYIPDSWEDITFKTTDYDINIPAQPDFGHLVLLY